MDKQAAQRYAERIREQEDQATAALRMADHVTGHYWLSLYSALDLARMADEKGGTLTMRNGSTYTTADAIASIHQSLEGMRADLEALKEATENSANNTAADGTHQHQHSNTHRPAGRRMHTPTVSRDRR